MLLFLQKRIYYVCNTKINQMKIFIIAILALVSFSAGAQITPAASGVAYGTSFNNDHSVSVEALSQTLQKENQFTGKVKGKVVGVCEKKGCWMKLANAAGDEIMVKFEDYGFFVPSDINGREIVLEGTAKKSVTSVSKLQHYAKDAGKSAEEIAMITSPKEEIEFIATGVLVL